MVENSTKNALFSTPEKPEYVIESNNYGKWRFCIAPMLDWTDRHDRYFLRLISQEVRLYTEMVTTGALLNGDRAYLLAYDVSEHPLALQLGGSNPDDLARCTVIAAEAGYDEVNLNVGCPSDRVQSGRFGACLMAEPKLVADCFRAMQTEVSLPVTIKCRIGIDDMEGYEHLRHFVTTLADAGCQTFIVHARKAWLQGLSPKENREIPPLHYDYVYQLKQEFPTLNVCINGGIQTLDECEQHLAQVDGVMVGRAAYNDPYLLAGVDSRFFGDSAPAKKRSEIFHDLLPYIEEELAKGCRIGHITRHILGLFQGLPGGRLFRRHLSEHSHKADAGIQTLLDAYAYVADRNPGL